MLGTIITFIKLGVSNLARVIVYRVGLKLRLHPVICLRNSTPTGVFYRESERTCDTPPPNHLWEKHIWWFGWHQRPIPRNPPNWFENPFSEAPQPSKLVDWWEIGDFDAGDIKGLWELSRFTWAPAWATLIVNGDAGSLKRLNAWVNDWCLNNPPYKGPHWKCGQEASIRVLHTITTAWILGQEQSPESSLTEFIAMHLKRIETTLSYAIGQQNNHGTSEAAALFVGGSFLAGHHPKASTWTTKGRGWLEKLGVKLFQKDGSFSQYSVNYHRLALDTYSLAEAWRAHINQPVFSGDLLSRIAMATSWLCNLTDYSTGDAPNIGANDGAHIIPLTNCGYRDFRPSIQLASNLFMGVSCFDDGPWNDQLRWLGVESNNIAPPLSNATYRDGGYHVLRHESTLAVLKFPNYKFRPSQADALHLDFWHEGTNILRDAGSFSYNSAQSNWYTSAAAHNTVEFDKRDQMPKVRPFLFSRWLKSSEIEDTCSTGDTVHASASYIDNKGMSHERHITLNPEKLICRDRISGDFKIAHLRWRISSNLVLDRASKAPNTLFMAITVNGRRYEPTISMTDESRYYQKESQTPLAVVKIQQPSEVVTTIWL